MDPFTIALLGGSAISGGLNYLGSQNAANTQANAAQQSGLLGLAAQQQAIQAQQQAQQQAVGALTQYGTQAQSALQAGQTGALGALGDYYGQGVGFQQPYMGAGAGAVNQLAQLYGQGGAYTQQPTYEQLQMDPGYAFRFQQGQQAMTNAARAGGLAGSGGALKAAARYGQEAGSQEYQNAYARFMANRAAATQGLQNLAGLGANAAQTATGLAGTTGANTANVYAGTGQNMAQAALTTGQNIGSAYTGTGSNIAALTGANPYGQAMENAAQAQASSYMGGASALSNALNSGMSNALAYNMMGNMYPQGPSGSYQFGGQSVPYFIK
jgi:hypothetical protein